MPDQTVIICRKRGTEAYFSKQVLEYLEDKIGSSPTPIPVTEYSLFNEFSRFACENKLTLSVFVNMSFKYNKLFIQYIIYCLKKCISGHWRTWRCCPVIFRKNSRSLCQKEAHAEKQHEIFPDFAKSISTQFTKYTTDDAPLVRHTVFLLIFRPYQSSR